MRSIYMSLFFVVVLAVGCAPALVTPPAKDTLSRREPAPVPAVIAVAVTPPSEAATPIIVEVPRVPEPPAPPLPPPGTEDREKAFAWMMGFMTRVAPPGRTTFYAEAKESKDEALARYRDIANAVIEVVYDPKMRPLFRGPAGRARTASVVLAVMLHESGFMRNVDYGLGKYGRGDHGNSWCLAQLNVGSQGTGRTMKWNIKEDRTPRFGDDPKDIFEGFTGPELVKDRHTCIREGLKVMRVSFTSCSNRPLEERLNIYASGNCDDGVDKSRDRMNTAIKFWDETRTERNFSDKAIVGLIEATRQTPPSSIPAPNENKPAPNPTLAQAEH